MKMPSAKKERKSINVLDLEYTVLRLQYVECLVVQLVTESRDDDRV